MLLAGLGWLLFLIPTVSESTLGSALKCVARGGGIADALVLRWA